MASRRPFFSVILVLAIAVLLVLGNSGGIARRLRSGTLTLLTPLLRLGAAGGQFLNPASDALPAIEAAQRLKAFEVQIETLRQENQDLSRALGITSELDVPVGVHRVLLYQQHLGRESLLVEVGKEQPIAVGNLVLDPQQIVVGRVLELGRGSATVDLGSNPGNRFEAEILPLNLPVLAEGLGGRAFRLQLIPRDAPIRVGDLVILPGPNRAERLLLGQIASVQASETNAFQEARAIAIVHPELIGTVLVLSTRISP